MNTNVSSYMDNFPGDYADRVERVNIETRKIRFYTLSLEDLVISKLAAGRDKDLEDIANESVLASVNWVRLEELADTVRSGMLSDRARGEFDVQYNEYVRRYKG